MKIFEFLLSEQTASKAQESAERLKLSPEAFLLLSIEEKLTQISPEFMAVSDYVLKKNAELYRRLGLS